MKLFLRSTFQGKLLVLFVLFSILPLSIVALIVYQTVRERYEDVLESSFRQTAALEEQLLGRFLESQISLVRSLAAQDILLAELEKAAVGESFDETEVFVTLISIRRENPFIEKVYVLDASGTVVISTATDETGHSFARRSFFRVPVQDRASYIGDVVKSTYGKRVIPLSAPLVRKSDNSVMGALVVELNSSVVHSATNQEAGRSGGVREGLGEAEVYVVDADGYLLTRLPTKGFTDRVETHPVVRCREHRAGAGGLWQNYAGERVLGVSRCLSFGDLHWTLVVEQEAHDAFQVSRRLGLTILLITLAVGLVLIFVIFAVSHSITDPIRLLRRGARELGAGNFDYKISVNTGDEFEELAKDFEETRKHLRNARRREAHLANMKSEFISIAAHQLRTPLTGIKWSLEEFFSKHNPADYGDLKQALASVYAMIRLVNDLLDVTRIEEGRFDYHFTEGDLVEFVRRVSREVEPRLAQQLIELDFEEPQHPVPTLRFDEEKMRMVFINVLDNAIKYTPAGGSISIAFAAKEDEVVVTVRDTGIGIPQDQVGNIFSKFFRAENAQQVHTSGSGLGLFVSQQIIRAHGGTIWVKSKENEGTLVCISLPYEHPDTGVNEQSGPLHKMPKA